MLCLLLLFLPTTPLPRFTSGSPPLPVSESALVPLRERQQLGLVEPWSAIDWKKTGGGR